MTQNYIIFLRNGNEFMMNHSSDLKVKTEKLNLLLNMIPPCHLKVKKPRKRTLEILFPSGSVCYFKLLIGPGCGKAWAQWRNLVQMCDQEILSLTTVSTLIPFPQLDIDVQRNLLNEKFLTCFTPLLKHLTETGDSESDISSGFTGQNAYSAADDSGLDSGISLATVYSFKKEKGKEENYSQVMKEIFEDKDYPNRFSRPAVDKRKNKVRKTKPVSRFGEGIAENCVFQLSLSYSDELVVDKNSSKRNTEAEVLDEFYNSVKQPTLNIARETKSDSYVSIRKKIRMQNGGTPEERIDINNHKDVQNILKAVQCFANVSLLTTPGGLRRSKSLDSLSKIVGDKDKNCLRCNLSVPDVHEMPLYSRYDRLSYALDHFEKIPSLRLTEGHSSHGIAFWLPSDNTSSGRIYCTAPICKKIFAYKRRTCLIR